MTRTELISEIKTTHPNITDDELKSIVEDFLKVVSQTALAGEEVKLTGFGKFSQKVIKPRKMAEALGGKTTEGRTTIKFKSYL